MAIHTILSLESEHDREEYGIRRRDTEGHEVVEWPVGELGELGGDKGRG